MNKKNDSTISNKITEKNQDIITASLVIIGDEILSGRTKDRNIYYIADYLGDIGIQLREVRVVGDDEADIVTAVNALRVRYDYVFTTGGIGPTHDDITADSIAKAFGAQIGTETGEIAHMPLRSEAERLTSGTDLPMARIPPGAEPIHDPVSAAPGFMLENVIVLAGVPQIMQVMLDDVAPRLRTGRKLVTRATRVRCPEGDVALELGQLQAEFPGVRIGSYPFFENDALGTHVVLRSTDAALLGLVFDRLLRLLESKGFR